MVTFGTLIAEEIKTWNILAQQYCWYSSVSKNQINIFKVDD
jgi:hypothetical protein